MVKFNMAIKVCDGVTAQVRGEKELNAYTEQALLNIIDAKQMVEPEGTEKTGKIYITCTVVVDPQKYTTEYFAGRMSELKLPKDVIASTKRRGFEVSAETAKQLLDVIVTNAHETIVNEEE